MSDLRTVEARKADVLGALEGQRDLWLATADTSGRPHLVAVSAWWDGTDLVVAGLRELYSVLPEHLMAAAGRAFQTLEWYHGHAYCGRCGTPTELSGTEMARSCPACGAVHFPRVTPAVIMLVEREGEVLLARNRRFAGPFYSVLAGFVEPGETLEQAVAREVGEEAGIEIGDVRYFGSQSWPFPSQLMIGFFARHSAGEVKVDGSELIEASWFRPEQVAAGEIQLPGPFSIARRLIDHWLQRSSIDSRRGFV